MLARKGIRGGSAVAGLVLLAAGLAPGSAAAASLVAEGSTTAAAACGLSLGSVTAGGDQVRRQATATVPPTVEPWWVTADVYAAAPRLSSTLVYEPDIANTHVHGWVVFGDSMYRSSYDTGTDFQLEGAPRLERVGGGWGTFVAFEDAQYWVPGGSFYRHNAYGLRNDGKLFRWTVDTKGVWHASGSYAGFSSVKSMALISKTRTYDTFLMNLRGGALYTVRIPTSSPMKPVVKIVRSGTWQGFESLIAEKCGTQGPSWSASTRTPGRRTCTPSVTPTEPPR